jgi:predicted RNA-binding Zn ribbon-like protein
VGVNEVELAGNALCLDYVNTVNARPQPRSDRLVAAESAVHWASAVGYRLNTADLTAGALADARAFRELLHGIFRAVVDGRQPAGDDLARLARAYADAVATAHIAAGQGAGFALAWRADGSLDALLHRITDSAVRLLDQGRLERIGACPSCGWLFLDTSKNGRRRWCSMATCGARDKARRHYLAATGAPHHDARLPPRRSAR